MNLVNPIYIPRNHRVEEALQVAEKTGDLAPFTKLQDVLQNPFTERDNLTEFEGPAPKSFGPYTTFCGT